MGMYDYRPYVRRVSNNRQIMFECRRGYTILHGPPRSHLRGRPLESVGAPALRARLAPTRAPDPQRQAPPPPPGREDATRRPHTSPAVAPHGG
ncbi:hypothetical protein MTO96_017423 [Rhipicephalus appendiculatus]